MAVVIQPMVQAQVAGIAYSIHPVTGRDNQVTINAIRGLGLPLVEGIVAPAHYIVEIGADRSAAPAEPLSSSSADRAARHNRGGRDS